MTTTLPVADSEMPFTLRSIAGIVFDGRRMSLLGKTLFDNPFKEHSCFPSKMRHQAWPSDHPEVAL